ncbi:MAG: alginate export family protein [Cyclobacteriaceae bacterium]
MKKFIYIILLTLIAEGAVAQLSLTGEVRPRAEFRNGFKKLNSAATDPALFIEQRSRLYINFKQEKFDFQITMQDIRLWGENAQIYKADNGMFNIYEAYGSYKIDDVWSVKVGRQALNYDNARFLGNLDWAQQGRSHDAFLLRYESDFTFHLGAAFNQEDVVSKVEPARLASTYYATGGNYKTMQYLWMNQKYDAGNTSLLVLNNGVQMADSTVNFGQTFGLFSQNNLGGLNLVAEAYYQMGKDGADKNINAYMFALNGTVKIGKGNIGLGGELLSGTNAGDTDNNAFNPLYGTNHKFYGLMDYFYVGNPHGNVGLTDIYLKGVIPTGDRSKLIAHAHYFMSAADFNNLDGSSADKYLGSELDLIWNINLQKDVNLKIGYSHMLASESMEILKGGDNNELNNWAWVMISFKPELFNSATN